ncbi:MAG: hypothetical protein R3E76_10165 [Planctomycetota bacterium]
MLETFSPVCAFQFQRLIGEDKMESTATATITKIGDEYFLPIDDVLLAFLLARGGNDIEVTVSDTRLVLRANDD